MSPTRYPRRMRPSGSRSSWPHLCGAPSSSVISIDLPPRASCSPDRPASIASRENVPAPLDTNASGIPNGPSWAFSSTSVYSLYARKTLSRKLPAMLPIVPPIIAPIGPSDAPSAIPTAARIPSSARSIPRSIRSDTHAGDLPPTTTVVAFGFLPVVRICLIPPDSVDQRTNFRSRFGTHSTSSPAVPILVIRPGSEIPFSPRVSSRKKLSTCLSTSLDALRNPCADRTGDDSSAWAGIIDTRNW